MFHGGPLFIDGKCVSGLLRSNFVVDQVFSYDDHAITFVGRWYELEFIQTDFELSS